MLTSLKSEIKMALTQNNAIANVNVLLMLFLFKNYNFIIKENLCIAHNVEPL